MGSSPVRRERFPLSIFLLTFVVFAYFMPQWADWNVDSRFDLVRAIVDGGTLKIDRYHFNTWDKAVRRDPVTGVAHFYSDKAPGTAMLGALAYAGFKFMRTSPVVGGAINRLERNAAWKTPIALGRLSTQAAPAAKGTNLGGCQRAGIAHNVQYIPWGNRLYPPFRDWALSKYLVTIVVVGLLSALFAAFLFWFLGTMGVRPLVRWIAVMLYSFATVALAYSSTFYSHQLAAVFLFTAFGLLTLAAQKRLNRWAVPAAGFLLGFSFFTEYTVAIVVAIVGAYGLWVLRSDRTGLAQYALAGAIPVVGLGVYNYLCFGGPLDTGYSHDFCWSASQAGGFAGFTYPKIGPLFDLTLGTYRGLFFQSPWLLLAIPGVYFMAKRLRSQAVVCVLAVVLFILAISAYWGWNGGKTDGARYLVPIVPFLVLPCAFAIERFWSSTPGKWLTAVLATLSVVITWALMLGGSTFPTSWLRNPLLDYSLPHLRDGQITSNAGLFLGLSGWPSLIPLLVLGALLLFWSLRSAQVRRTTSR